MRVRVAGPAHAMVGVVGVAVPPVIARPGMGVMAVVRSGMVAMVVVHPVAVDCREGVVPGRPGPPEDAVVGPCPQPVAIVAYPDGVMVTVVVWAPPVGVRPFEDAPVGGDVTDGMRVVVPVVISALVQVGVTHEVKHPVNFVDEVLRRIEPIHVLVQIVLSTPGAEVLGDRVGPEVLIESNGSVCRRGARHGENRREDAECSRQHYERVVFSYHDESSLQP